MKYEVSFGRLGGAPRPAALGQKFRLALLGDFSGRANAGNAGNGRSAGQAQADQGRCRQPRRRAGADEAQRSALPLVEDGDRSTVEIGSDRRFPPRPARREPRAVRSSCAPCAATLPARPGSTARRSRCMSWGGEAPVPPPPRRARGAAVATDASCRTSPAWSAVPAIRGRGGSSADDLLRRLVGPFIVPARDPRQDALIARVDEALSAAMRRVLHHPDFQTAEAIWRGVEFLVRRIETGARMEIVLYDVSAEELAADLAATDALEDTGLYGMLVEQPALDAHQGPLSAVIGLYDFELAPPHADLLGRMAQIAAAAGAPFVAGIGPDPLLHSVPRAASADPGCLDRAAGAAGRRLSRAGRAALPAAHAVRQEDRPDRRLRLRGVHPPGGPRPACCGATRRCSPALLLAETLAQQGAKMKLGTVMGVRRHCLLRRTSTPTASRSRCRAPSGCIPSGRRCRWPATG